MGWKRTRPPQGDVVSMATGGYARVAPPESGPRPEREPADQDARAFPCEKCGSSLRFAPGQLSLVCDHCRHEQKVPEEIIPIAMHDLDLHGKQTAVPTEVLGGSVGETRCTGCGAVVEVPASVKTTTCVFCGAHLTNTIEPAKPMMRPDGVYPFGLTHEQAKGLFLQWVRTRWMAPSELKSVDRAESLRGIYVPFWAYDVHTQTPYAGQRGDWRWQGKHRDLVWTPVAGVAYGYFRNVMIAASTGLPHTLTDHCGPWKPAELRPWNAAYLSGFHAERYQLSALQSFEFAKDQLDPKLEQNVRLHIGGDEQRIRSMHINYTQVGFRLVLAPIWVLTYRIREKSYLVIVNARNGSVQGEYPRARLKALLLALACIIVPLALFAGVVLMLRHFAPG